MIAVAGLFLCHHKESKNGMDEKVVENGTKRVGNKKSRKEKEKGYNQTNAREMRTRWHIKIKCEYSWEQMATSTTLGMYSTQIRGPTPPTTSLERCVMASAYILALSSIEQSTRSMVYRRNTDGLSSSRASSRPSPAR